MVADWEKSAALAPEIKMLEISTANGLLLVNVAFLDALGLSRPSLPNPRVAGVNAAGTTPLPLSATVCAMPKEESLMLMAAVSAPTTDGVKVIVDLQLAPTARVLPHNVVSAKSAAFAPVTLTLICVTGAVEVFLIVSVCDVLVEPRA